MPLFEKEGVLLAYLFGSLAQKGEKLSRPRPPGDVDLAILTKEGPAYNLLEAIIDVLGTDRLDLVDLRKASPVLRFEVLRSDRPIYVSDEDLRERYEMETIHLYRDTEPMRRRQREVLKERMEAMCSKERYFNKPKR
jgi:predicted nucleotidyltransferase